MLPASRNLMAFLVRSEGLLDLESQELAVLKIIIGDQHLKHPSTPRRTED